MWSTRLAIVAVAVGSALLGSAGAGVAAIDSGLPQASSAVIEQHLHGHRQHVGRGV